MKLYLISLAAGLLVGVIYGVLNVRSPPRRSSLWSACLEFSSENRSFRWRKLRSVAPPSRPPPSAPSRALG